ncbi:hypothetical protein OV450_1389 [Actinobacteria bacterium OV450]|nr:hypothetical protein OV450_1389 [Actinobacteria bacterium OV450]
MPYGLNPVLPASAAQAIADRSQEPDVDPIEQAKLYKLLVDGGHSPAEIAAMAGKEHVPAITERIALLNLTEANQRRIENGTLPVGLAWYIARLDRDGQGYMTVRWLRGEFTDARDAELTARRLHIEQAAATA